MAPSFQNAFEMMEARVSVKIDTQPPWKIKPLCCSLLAVTTTGLLMAPPHSSAHAFLQVSDFVGEKVAPSISSLEPGRARAMGHCGDTMTGHGQMQALLGRGNTLKILFP